MAMHAELINYVTDEWFIATWLRALWNAICGWGWGFCGFGVLKLGWCRNV